MKSFSDVVRFDTQFLFVLPKNILEIYVKISLDLPGNVQPRQLDFPVARQ